MVTLHPRLRRLARKILILRLWDGIYCRSVRRWPARFQYPWDQILPNRKYLAKRDRERTRFHRYERQHVRDTIADWEAGRRGLEISDTGCLVLGEAEIRQNQVNRGEISLDQAVERMTQDFLS